MLLGPYVMLSCESHCSADVLSLVHRRLALVCELAGRQVGLWGKPSIFWIRFTLTKHHKERFGIYKAP